MRLRISCGFWQRSVPATEVRQERAITLGQAARALQYDAKSAEVKFWARMSQKRIAFRALSAKTCQKAKKEKANVDQGQFSFRYELCASKAALAL